MPSKRMLEQHFLPRFVVIFLAVIIAGCAQTTVLKQDDLNERLVSGTRVLLMPPDVELYELTAAGLLEPKAGWTASAKQNVAEGLRAELRAKHAEMVVYDPHTGDPSREYAHQQILKLHDVVGTAIIAHHFTPRLQLPTKQGKFEWSLGKGVSALRNEYGADYALFIFFRDSYASAGRVGLMVVMAVAGVGIPGGTQVGFASLLDLRSGAILWFDRLINPAGNLREAESARDAVRTLLTGFPYEMR